MCMFVFVYVYVCIRVCIRALLDMSSKKSYVYNL